MLYPIREWEKVRESHVPMVNLQQNSHLSTEYESL